MNLLQVNRNKIGGKYMYRLGIDTGGTFTDFTLVNKETGKIDSFKIPSTPDDPGRVIIEGIRTILCQGIEKEEIEYFGHGTTVGTNAVIELTGAKTGLITTDGFKDLLEIRRQKRPDLFDFYADKPPILVDEDLRKEVHERINFKGKVIRQLDIEDIEKVVKNLLHNKVQSIAVCLLNAYANPKNEKKILRYLQKVAPKLFIYLSSEVLPEFREYERLSTTVLCAYLGPVVYKYIQRLSKNVRSIGLRTEPYITKSNGGIMTCASVKDKPIETALSGPASGVMAATYLSEKTGIKNLITFDLGGTSADISLVENGVPRINTNSYVIGYPVKIPMVDLITIGAGGGSIAWVDDGGALRVGPMSAGAIPGPACYGKRGEKPTVTDANMILKRINPEYILDGKMQMYPDYSYRAIHNYISKPLGLSVEEAAMGIIRIVNSNMLRAIRKISVDRGYNPSDFTFLSFGGGGGLHAAFLAKELGCSEILIPEHPGTFSSFGLLTTDFRCDFVRTHIMVADSQKGKTINKIFSDLVFQAEQWLRRQQQNKSKTVIEKYIDIRYQGQNYEHMVKINSGEINTSIIIKAIDDFHKKHHRRHGYSMLENLVEFINFRVVAYGIVNRPVLKKYPEAKTDPQKALKRYQKVYFNSEMGYQSCPIYVMDKLDNSNQIDGPAIIEQSGSTVLMPPDFQATIDKYKNILIRIK
jgi:N-methylhydantoinase A